jgi:putative Mg2+ transporter-C (MgtC) family protein
MNMPLHPTWPDIAMRLLLTLVAGIALGLNRGARSQAAGFRTTILVGLAACVAMIQANLLLDLEGKTSSSFGVMDLMRLPLGILTGVGFIGGGTILKRGDIVTGVTTAAALWIISVIGLCFGGGQLGLGMIATILAITTLWILKRFDAFISRDHRALVSIITDKRLSILELNTLIKPLGYFAFFHKKKNYTETKQWEFEIHWKRSDRLGPPSDLLNLLENNYTVESFELAAEKSDH